MHYIIYSTYMVLKYIDYIGLNSILVMVKLYKENNVFIEIMGKS